MATGRVPTTANSPLTTKGDLFGYSTTQARVAVGSDGDTLVADSAATTGLRWQGNYAAAKNVLLNSDFRIWQRGTSFSNPANEAYVADRFNIVFDGTGSTRTISRQTFTPGAAPVSGYEGEYFLRFNQSVAGSGGTYVGFNQRMEDVRTFAGQTVTLSFWAKADATRTILPNLQQNFGSGGSSTVNITSGFTSTNLTTSWARYTYTVSIPSISSKTVGTSSFLQLFFGFAANTVQTIDIWGVQLEAGSVATAFQTATGTLQGELAACQRYYWRTTAGANYGNFANGMARNTTQVFAQMPAPVTFRVRPTAIDYGGTIIVYDGVTETTATSLTINSDLASTTDVVGFRATVASGLTQYRPYQVSAGADANAYIAISVEL